MQLKTHVPWCYGTVFHIFPVVLVPLFLKIYLYSSLLIKLENQKRRTLRDFWLPGNVIKGIRLQWLMKGIRWAVADPPTHWPGQLPEGPTGPTPSASGFHAVHRTWTCVPAKKDETLPGNCSDAKSTEGTDPEGPFPLWVERHLVEEHNTQYFLPSHWIL